MDQQLQGEGLGAGEEGEEGGQAVAQLDQGDDPSTATQLRWGLSRAGHEPSQSFTMTQRAYLGLLH